ncbi:MAG: hypothetical protein U0234_33540 [Sandaracinus sp.]
MSAPVSGIADLRDGALVAIGDEDHEALSSFASIAPEIFADDRSVWASLLLERAHAHGAAVALEELVLVTPSTVHVAQRLPANRSRALLTVGAWAENVGTVLGVARERLRELEPRP